MRELPSLTDFSLVAGGPLYQLYLRTRMAGPRLDLLHRRMVLIPLIAWLPLLVLSVVEGRAAGGALTIPFLHDIEVHARYLIALPLLIAAELMIHLRLRPAVLQFLQRGIVPAEARPRFDAIVASATRLRNSVAVELTLLAFVYIVGHYIWGRQHPLSAATWFASVTDSGPRLTWAGSWYAWISIPVFQFILLRWYFRLFVWIRFLWQVSRFDLRLLPTHPDHAGGLGFLDESCTAFASVLVAQSVLLSGTIAQRIFSQGARLPDFKVEIAGTIGLLLLLVLAPLCAFSGHLVRARRHGIEEYGPLASRYVTEFDHKWIRGGAPEGEPLVGSADIQSLADLANSFEVVQTMRLVPFGKEAVIQLVLAVVLPILPLLLTMFPIEELAAKLVEILL